MRAVSLLFHDVYVSDPVESGFASEAANRYKVSLADFDALLSELRQARTDAPILATEIAATTAGDPFLLTADDGGMSYYTWMADRLEDRGWFGHCFVSTDFIGRRGFLDVSHLRELDRRGHLIGSHSASHPPRFSALPFDRMVAEWAHSRRVLEDVLGRPVDTGSVPGGYFSAAVARAAHEAGIRVLFTSEPVRRISSTEEGLVMVGRFTIRRGDPPDTAARLAGASPWARSAQWISWNAKALVKPLLGPSYGRLADWLLTPRASNRTS